LGFKKASRIACGVANVDQRKPCSLRPEPPFLVKLYADAGYQGQQFQSALKPILERLSVEIVKTIRSRQKLHRPAQALDR